MKISLNWIKEFTTIPEKYSAKELSHLLTIRTCEVEGYEVSGEGIAKFDGVVIGEIKAFEKMADSDKLHVAQVDIGKENPIQVVFGSMVEMKVGARVPVAVAPAVLPSGMAIDAKKIRGVLTEGMLCLEQELGLKKDGVSILYFPQAKPGTPFGEAYKKHAQLHNIVLGKAISVNKHPNADRLRVADVDIGGKVTRIVCGGQNLKDGMFLAIALPGAQTRSHDGEIFEIKTAKIRGEESNGMICAEEELSLPTLTPQEGVTIADMAVVLPKLGIKKMPPLGTLLVDALKQDGDNKIDTILEVDNKSLTHRPDLWGHYGMAREFAAFLGQKLKPFAPKVKFPTSGEKVKVVMPKEIGDRFVSVIIKGVKIEESPVWLKQRLSSTGMRPVNNIVDVTNYVMIETGHPMHAFDRKALGTDTLAVRFAKKGEVMEEIDHKKRTLSEQDALVTNGKDAMAIAGVMGGADSEISAATTEIVLEAACWNHILIRKTSQRHGLRTDAAQRFEKSLDPELSILAIERACELILKICKGAQIAGPITDVYNKKPAGIAVTLDTKTVNSKIGAEISEKEIAGHLKSLGFSVKKAQKGKLQIAIPSWRATKDVNIEDDLVEEVARMYGYEKIAPTLPMLPINAPRANKERQLENLTRSILSNSLGFDEVSFYSFYGMPEIKKCMLPVDAHVTIQNPLTEDQTHMRISLLPNMLKAVEKNLNVRESFKIYEMGRTYIKGPEFFPREEKFICGVVIGSFHDGLGALQAFLKAFPINARVETGATLPPYAHPAKCATLKAKGTEIATVYEVHPQILKNFGIKTNVAVFEINFTRLAELGQDEKSYTKIPRFPGIEIDVSVLVNKKTTVREIQELIRHTDQNLIANISLIDIFEDKSLGEDKKSFTFRILLQSTERTLTDEEMKKTQERIFKTLRDSGFAIRGL